MNKDIIEMQRNCNATCVIILDEHHQELNNSLIIDSDIEDYKLYSGLHGAPIFKEQLENISKEDEITYLVIRNLDKITEEKQNRYLGLVKDRHFQGYDLPKNIIIVLTITNKEQLNKISKDLYHYSVAAF